MLLSSYCCCCCCRRRRRRGRTQRRRRSFTVADVGERREAAPGLAPLAERPHHRGARGQVGLVSRLPEHRERRLDDLGAERVARERRVPRGARDVERLGKAAKPRPGRGKVRVRPGGVENLTREGLEPRPERAQTGDPGAGHGRGVDVGVDSPRLSSGLQSELCCLVVVDVLLLLLLLLLLSLFFDLCTSSVFFFSSSSSSSSFSFEHQHDRRAAVPHRRGVGLDKGREPLPLARQQE